MVSHTTAECNPSLIQPWHVLILPSPLPCHHIWNQPQRLFPILLPFFASTLLAPQYMLFPKHKTFFTMELFSTTWRCYPRLLTKQYSCLPWASPSTPTMYASWHSPPYSPPFPILQSIGLHWQITSVLCLSTVIPYITPLKRLAPRLGPSLTFPRIHSSHPPLISPHLTLTSILALSWQGLSHTTSPRESTSPILGSNVFIASFLNSAAIIFHWHVPCILMERASIFWGQSLSNCAQTTSLLPTGFLLPILCLPPDSRLLHPFGFTSAFITHLQDTTFLFLTEPLISSLPPNLAP